LEIALVRLHADGWTPARNARMAISPRFVTSTFSTLVGSLHLAYRLRLPADQWIQRLIGGYLIASVDV
jgi:hypothetical protein